MDNRRKGAVFTRLSPTEVATQSERMRRRSRCNRQSEGRVGVLRGARAPMKPSASTK